MEWDRTAVSITVRKGLLSERISVQQIFDMPGRCHVSYMEILHYMHAASVWPAINDFTL